MDSHHLPGQQIQHDLIIHGSQNNEAWPLTSGLPVAQTKPSAVAIAGILILEAFTYLTK